ncbi:E3 ubiquitin-protein ligase TRIM17-like [Littorina saxatilis]|uniref:Uncharacterized protein n=1 Tax=Littorina saxatilis TaxID=31220 RepID=A0AAN9B4F9_9CAEN
MTTIRRRPSDGPNSDQKPKFLANSYEREDSDLQCSNCRNSFHRQEILVLESCGHNVCQYCMEEAEEHGKYICPVCLEDTNTTNGSPEPEPERENSYDAEKSGITTARQIYIGDPKNSPRRLKAKKPPPPPEDQVREMKPFCFMHSKDREFYCLDCDTPMCPVCASSDIHSRFHRMRDLGEVVAILRQNTAYAQECIDGELRREMQEIMAHEENFRKHLPKKLETLRERVEHQARAVVRLVEEAKLRTGQELEHYADVADKVMHKRVAKMNRQLNAAKRESQRLSEIHEVSEAEAIKMHGRMHDFFIKNKERNFSSFFVHSRTPPDFNVMATVSVNNMPPKELTEAVKRHVGWAIEGAPAIVNDTRRTPEYPLMQKGFPVHKSNFPKYLNETKKIILEWKKFARTH